MNLLLLLPLLVLGSPPMPVAPAPRLSLGVGTVPVTFKWENVPRVGVSNFIEYGESPVAMTNRFYVGTVTAMTNDLPTTKTNWFQLAPIHDGVPGVKSERVHFPGDKVYDFMSEVDGKATVLVSYTNQPPGRQGQIWWRVREKYNE